MRSVSLAVRRVFVGVVVLAIAGSAFAAPRENRDPRDRTWKIVKKVVRSLGDLITIPTPPPTKP